MNVGGGGPSSDLRAPLIPSDDPERGQEQPDDVEEQVAPKAADRWVQIKGASVRYLTPETVYCSNTVITSRYTWWNFVPLNLWEQFQNLANLYFLMVGILQMIPAVSTTQGIPTMYQPLAFIVLVSALRAASEDLGKHKADSKRNGKLYRVLSEQGFTSKSSGDLRVGDVVEVRRDEMIPADLLLLSTGLPRGHCFVDRSNLNGETTLEVLTAPSATRDMCRPAQESYFNPAHGRRGSVVAGTTLNEVLSLTLNYEPPNGKFDTLRGTLKLASGEEAALDGKCLLMRETSIRNCPYIWGLVLYTGPETKIQMSNSDGTQVADIKRSRVMDMVNVFLKVMLMLQVSLCGLAAVWSATWTVSHESDSWYLGPSEDVWIVRACLSFFSWFILLSQLVPISLIVSAEMVKFAQSMFIQWDVDLYWGVIDKPTKCNSSTIHEDLGLTNFIFSDKTGTLTQNKMEFRYVMLDVDTSFGSRETEISKRVQRRRKELLELGAPKRRRRGSAFAAAGGYGPEAAAAYGLELEEVGNGGEEEVKVPGEQRAPPTASPAAREEPVIWTRLMAGLLPPPDTPEERLETDCCPRLPWNQPPERYRLHYYGLNQQHNPYRRDPEAAAAGPIDEGQFTPQQRLDLLQALWGPGSRQPPSQGKEEDPDQAELGGSTRERLYRYMIHMALSNTVKPYTEEAEDTEERKGDGDQEVRPEDLKFQSESAEELAMVLFARSCGFTKISQNPTVLEIQEYDEQLQPTERRRIQYNHVATLGFTSKRARVTVIYERADTKEIEVMSKGQDTVVLPLLSRCPRYEALMLELKDLCNNGLRTLVCAWSSLPASWWAERAARYNELLQLDDESPFSQGHSSGKCAPKRCERCIKHQFYEQLERDAGLGYLGCIGLEDRLQLLVPEAIEDFALADIKVWMITGDKLETAKNIGLACNLIDPDMEPVFGEGDSLEKTVEAFADSRLIQITGQWAEMIAKDDELSGLFRAFDAEGQGRVPVSQIHSLLTALRFTLSPEKLAELLRDGGAAPNPDAYVTEEDFLRLVRSTNLSLYDAVSYDVEAGVKRYNRIQNHQSHPISLLVNREAFQVMFPPPGKEDPSVSEEQRETLRRSFFLLASGAKSVVFARAEPAMKKRMVTEIRARFAQAVTLAVGDGANDADMIRAAHIGVGIAGVEGSAASNAADYAVGTFSMLHTLLFVHGFWCYHRTAGMVNFIFYKACLLALTSYCFGFDSAFSGQQFYNDPPYQLFNVCFTALPVLAVAILDQKLPRHVLQNNPLAFREARGLAFRSRSFWGWIGRAVVHAIIIYLVPRMALASGVMGLDGQTHGLWYMSTVVFYGTVLVPTFMILWNMTVISLVHVLAVLSSFSSLLFFTFLLNEAVGYNPDLFRVVDRLYHHPSIWLVLVLVIVLPMLAELTWKAGRYMLRPSFSQILREKNHLTQVQVDARLRSTVGLAEGYADLDDQEPITDAQLMGARLVEPAEYKREWLGRKNRTRRHNFDTAAQSAMAALEQEIERSGRLSVNSDADADPESVVVSSSGADERKQGSPRSSVRGRAGTVTTGRRWWWAPTWGGAGGWGSAATPSSTAQDAEDSSPSARASRRQELERRGVIRAMLQFRNLTGSQFSSAAQGRLQQHDPLQGEALELPAAAAAASGSAAVAE